ncbi:hypothetical protein PILCRDRAFT_820678 [Piloderma croceum F 1598]|uniref:Homeobox domain-containing protein n=1 Tax=Piloderma croceum (strain F 1598) TaxID=765440 RepID=A0A0C3FCG4_PILCF|nr:hypothetical protein PILCRDRAFT_820678 [Piloderma croceum F 1598]
MPPSLSRTSSSTSVSSNVSTTSSAASASRRTRTRFTNEQLVMLEGLYHRSSHPTREERDDLAREAGMETKHITIWFQNKRQMDRRVALSNATNKSSNRVNYQLPHVPLSTTQSRAPTYTSTGIRRPSLDRIASHSELRNPPPRTPSRRHTNHNQNQNQNVWENMPSSPLGPPDTPESVREEAYLEFGRLRERAKGRRTLEWACASARVAGSASGKENRRGGVDGMHGDDVSMALDLDKLSEEEGGDETDEAEDVHEAVTPSSSFSKEEEGKRNPPGLLKAMIQDEDMMAAYILCGLGLGLR